MKILLAKLRHPAFLKGALMSVSLFSLILLMPFFPATENHKLSAADSPLHDETHSLVLRSKGVDKTPVIDGKLSDRCWQFSERATGFWRLHNRGPATQQTEVMTAYDANNLYLAFICYEKTPASIVRQRKENDTALWWEDCVEVFMDVNHDHDSYYHLIVNSYGAQYDEIDYSVPASWNSKATVAVSIGSDRWVVEMAIPFASMKIAAPAPGTQWGFNVNRQKYRPLERSSWSETRETFHEPKVFGHLLFLPYF